MASRVHWSEAEGKPLIDARKDEPGAMLPILHDLHGALRLHRRRRDPADRRRAQRVEGGDRRRRQFLPRFPPRAGAWRGAEDLPRRILPGGGLRGPGRPSRTAATASSPTRMTAAGVERRDGLLPRPLRRLARGDARRRADGAADPRGLDASRWREARPMMPHLHSRRTSTRGRARRRRGRARLRRGARSGAVEIVRTGSRGLYWLEPLVEIERDGVRLGYGPLAPEDAAGRAGAAAPIPRRSAGRGHRLSEAAAAADLRPLRRHRPAVARRLRGAWRRPRLAARAGARPRGDGQGSARTPACAGAAARASRPGSSGARSPASRPSRNTSSATPTRATAAPSPTAC